MREIRRESGPRDGLIEAAVVALSAAMAALSIRLFSPAEFHDTALVMAPAIAAGIAAAVTTRRAIQRRSLGSLRNNSRRLARAQSVLQDERGERAALREFVKSLDSASDESAVLAVAEQALGRQLAPHSTELHLVDRVDPILVLVVSTGNHKPLPDDRPSPWVSLAGRTSSTLVYETTAAPDICPHLARRLSEPVSAVAVPLSVGGGLLGVLYAFGPDGRRPGRYDVSYIEDIAAALANRLAVIRSTAADASDDQTDRLTGLPDRAATQRRLLSMIDERRSFTVAVADIDDLGHLNEIAGRDSGDRSLEILAATARRAVRPKDIVGRIGGDELLFIFPDTTPDDAVKALERLREALLLAQSSAEIAPFTLSVGVVASSHGGPIDKILMRAADALRFAKSEGGNRVVLTPKVNAEPPA